MGSYKAKKNELEGNQEKLEQNNLKKAQDQRNAMNNKKNLDNAADVAIATKNPYAVAAGYAYKGLNKLTGDKFGEKLGQGINKVNKIAPGGNQVQKASNKLSESGASDTAGTVARAKNKVGGKGKDAKGIEGKNSGNLDKAKTNSLNKSTNKNNINSNLKAVGDNDNNESKNGHDIGINIKEKKSKDSIIKKIIKWRIKRRIISILIGCLPLILFLLLLATTTYAAKDIRNLLLTNSSNMTVKRSTSSGDVLGKLEELSEFFISDVHEYSWSSYVKIPFLNNDSFRKDCSGFASAYMYYVSGVNLGSPGTGEMIGNSFKTSAANAGWIAYDASEIGDASNLLPGDVLVEHISGTNGHAEIYIDPTHTFGWGQVQSHYPLDKIISNNNVGGRVVFKDNYGRHNQYSLVFRYQP